MALFLALVLTNALFLVLMTARFLALVLATARVAALALAQLGGGLTKRAAQPAGLLTWDLYH
jgi:hypothetical protein